MTAAALVFAALASLLHVYIWVMESFTWTTPRTRAVFGTSAEEAETTRQLAFNQGFYNLFLALLAGAGVVLVAANDGGSDPRLVGATLLLAGVGSMAAAALVLLVSSDKTRAALTQLAFPLLAVVAFALS